MFIHLTLLTGCLLLRTDVILVHLLFYLTIGFAGGYDAELRYLLICLLAAKLIPENDCRFIKDPTPFKLPGRHLLF